MMFLFVNIRRDVAVVREGGASVRAFSIILILLGLAGCSLFVPKLEAPRLSVVGVELQKGALWQQ